MFLMFLLMPHVDSQLSCAGEYLLSSFQCRLTVMKMYSIQYNPHNHKKIARRVMMTVMQNEEVKKA